ncbi:hypothetical protein KPATCC21470_3693 [Kitasatospora purpeofusca]
MLREETPGECLETRRHPGAARHRVPLPPHPAFAVLLALAFATVVTGVITALKVHGEDEENDPGH